MNNCKQNFLKLSSGGNIILKYSFLYLGIPFFLLSCSAESTKTSAESTKTSAEVIRQEATNSNENLYVIEREIPGAGNLTQEELRGISQISNGVLADMGTQIKWHHSYVTGDMVYCVYSAPNEQMVRAHAEKGGFPANKISKVGTVIDPTTGN